MKFVYEDFSFPRSLRRRFVKNTSAPITLLDDPYFWHQVEFYSLKEDLLLFLDELSSFEDQEAYFSYCHHLMEGLIQVVKDDPKYSEFSSHEPLKVKHQLVDEVTDVPISYILQEWGFNNHPKNVYTDQNLGKTCVAWDISGANMISLLYFGLLQQYTSWKEFLSKMCSYEHLYDSKSFRQAVFGHLNPKRQQLLQRYMMMLFCKKIPVEGLLSLTSDEIILEVQNIKDEEGELSIQNISFDTRRFPVEIFSPFLQENVGIPVKQRQFVLHKVLVDTTQDFSHPVASCYIEKYEKSQTYTIKGCSKHFRSLVERSVRGEKCSELLWEYMFEFEHVRSEFLDDLYVSIRE